MTEPPSADVLTPHQGALWALCYRLTGCAADADDLVQETFQRALEHPPNDPDRPWRPWLLRVATHLSIDHLRRRQHAAYTGPWLPSPVELEGLPDDVLAIDRADADARYGAWESLSYAFLVALETLDPVARAVFVLREVLGWTGPEVSECLQLSPGNVRVILHRARGTMPTPGSSRLTADRSRHEAMLGAFVSAIAAGDLAGVAALLAADARTVQDSAGEVKAALRVVSGRDNVARFFLGVTRFYPEGARAVEPRLVNGAPAFLVEMNSTLPGRSPRYIIRIELNEQGQIGEVQMILASRKLTHIGG